MGLQNGKAIKAQERRYQVLQLKKAGASERDIAQQLGVSHTQINKDVHRLLGDMAKANKPAADNVRALQNARYDEMIQSRWVKALQGDDDAFDLVLKTMTGINSIWGLRGIDIKDLPGSSPDNPLYTSIMELQQARQTYVEGEQPKELASG